MISTPWGEKFVFDAHTHFLPRSFFAQIGRQLGLGSNAVREVAGKLGWELPPENAEELAGQWLMEMDRHGVARMMAIHTLPGDLAEVGRGLRAASGRLIGYAMVNPLENGAAAALERAVAEHGFAGVALFPALFRFSMTSDEAYAVLDVANRHRLCVFVHCGILKMAFRTKLGLPSAFDATFANPLSLQRPAVDFPSAKFIVPHLGSGMFRELLMLADQAGNVYSDTSGVSGWAKYLSSSPSHAQVLRQAIDVMGADRLLFGTDSTFFPRGWRKEIFDQHVQIFQEAQLTADQVGLILGENLKRLIRA
jgi:predicted TIM-barrel fold metal-dependent hydrolase